MGVKCGLGPRPKGQAVLSQVVEVVWQLTLDEAASARPANAGLAAFGKTSSWSSDLKLKVLASSWRVPGEFLASSWRIPGEFTPFRKAGPSHERRRPWQSIQVTPFVDTLSGPNKGSDRVLRLHQLQDPARELQCYPCNGESVHAIPSTCM